MAGLYIHIPYCHSKCIYCDFFSTPRCENVDGYITALLQEYDLRHKEISEQWSTIYIGGGTPSIIPTEALDKLIDGLKSKIDIANIDEWTIEANPEDITAEWVKNIVRHGINRVSMGIQSFQDNELSAINRRHNAEKAAEAIGILRDNGIEEISGDLIYGLPEQTFESWQQSLDTLLSFRLPHFSAYLLSYEPKTKLYAMLQNGKIDEVTDTEASRRYMHLCEEARRAGYEHYEISNFSLSGHNAKHNSNYWKNKPYLGLGVSAHSFDGTTRRYNGNDIRKYVSSLEEGKICYETENETNDERHNDLIITALRTAEGINLIEYKNQWGEQLYQRLINISRDYISTKKMNLKDDRLAIAESSMLISDRIMLDFIL